MRKVIGKIFGCDLVLEYDCAYIEESRYHMETAENIVHILIEENKVFIHEKIFEK